MSICLFKEKNDMKKISVIVFIEYKIISRISIDSRDSIYILYYEDFT